MTATALYLALSFGVVLLVLCGLTALLERGVNAYFDYMDWEER